MTVSPGRRPTVRCFPSADRAFAAVVQRELATMEDTSAADAPDALEARLQQRYPTARVSPQDPLASFTGEAAVWYVYRRDSPDLASEPDTAPADAASTGSAEGEEPAPRQARPVYSTAAVSSMLGVPISILVAWDQQDGYVRPETTAGGVRLYSRDHLEDLLTVKRLTTAAATPDEIRAALGAERSRRRTGPFGSGRTGRRMLVLLAEHDPYAAEMSEYFLRTEGYDVDVAFSTVEAETRATAQPPDVAVVELLISGGAGAELCARLKAQTGGRIVAVSTLDFEEAALRSGADAFLRKPLDPLELVSTIKDLLGESALLRPAVVT
ncbi:MAG TPA: response regulator [Candidatus Limnocylindrales bacterium]|nr:response regulator [Candidatus Limnocylindrales bacterium]